VHSVFVTHPEVVIDPATSIEQWQLSALGTRRAIGLAALFRGQVDRVVSSSERKATETAAIFAKGLGVTWVVDSALGEMDRTSTGYLPPEEFDAVVGLFFAEPEQSIRGWERAIDAQHWIVDSIRRHTSKAAEQTAFVSHGGVGALLLASLTATPIDRTFDQPGLGSYFTFEPHNWNALSGWNQLPTS
jgi:broad specificity phosphatase PhoE